MLVRGADRDNSTGLNPGGISYKGPGLSLRTLVWLSLSKVEGRDDTYTTQN
jgi:hypothetical protein